MEKVISIHEYELKPDVEDTAFERALRDAEHQDLFRLPGLVGHHFVKGIKGSRRGKFAALWVYESRSAWEALWGPPDQQKERADYPENWQEWEKILEPFLIQNPDEITFTAYEGM